MCLRTEIIQILTLQTLADRQIIVVQCLSGFRRLDRHKRPSDRHVVASTQVRSLRCVFNDFIVALGIPQTRDVTLSHHLRAQHE